jgi:hypothetical protein
MEFGLAALCTRDRVVIAGFVTVKRDANGVSATPSTDKEPEP